MILSPLIANNENRYSNSSVLLRRITLSTLTKWSLPRLIGGISILIIFYILNLFIIENIDMDASFLANVLGPIFLVGLISFVGFKTIRRQSLLIWTPYGLFLVNIMLFWGVGPLVYYFANETTIINLFKGPLALTEFDLFRTNLLNAVGIFWVLLGIYLSKSKACKYILPAPDPGPPLPATVVGIIFLFFGLVLRYFVILPYAFGFTDFVLPATVNSLQHLSDLGLAVAAYLAAKGYRRWFIVLCLFLPLQVFTALLLFSKKQLVIAIILPVLGSYLAHRKLRVLLVWAIISLMAYYTVQPLVTFGRRQIKMDTGTIYNATLWERFDIIVRYFDSEEIVTQYGAEEEMTGWMRLEFAGQQSFIMHEYDQGRPNRTLRKAYLMLIPRIIWPNKPLTTQGEDFYEMITGHRGSQMGGTVFADGYWHFGWFGVVGFSLVMGLVIGIGSVYTLAWQSKKDFIFLPPAFLLLIDISLLGPGKFMNQFLGQIPIIIVYIFSINLFKKFYYSA